MKVWITKYALTRGILERDADVLAGDTIKYLDPGRFYPSYQYGDGKDWHRTEAGARARAEIMRLSKIASLQKQIAKLEKLEF